MRALWNRPSSFGYCPKAQLQAGGTLNLGWHTDGPLAAGNRSDFRQVADCCSSSAIARPASHLSTRKRSGRDFAQSAHANSAGAGTGRLDSSSRLRECATPRRVRTHRDSEAFTSRARQSLQLVRVLWAGDAPCSAPVRHKAESLAFGHTTNHACHKFLCRRQEEGWRRLSRLSPHC
jgi:hypothetical protein